MGAGKLRHRLRFERPTEVQDATGSILPGYEPLFTIWGQVRPLRGREFFAAQQVQSEVSTEILVRWRREINATLRVRHVDDVFDIASVVEDDKSGREWMRLMCVRRKADGWRSGTVDE